MDPQASEQYPLIPDVRPLADDTFVPDTSTPETRSDDLNWRDEQEEDTEDR